MDDLLKELENLNLPKDGFAVFGSGALGIRGLRKVNDLDIIVTPKLFRELASKFTVKKVRLRGEDREKINLGPGFEKFEIFDKTSLGFDSEEIIKRADVIDGIRFVRLEDLMEWKKRKGRQKDKEDIKLIEKYLQRRKI